MAFINIPVLFIEENTEQQENLGLKPGTKEGEIEINTNLLCAYNKMDNGNTMVRMASGDCVEVNIDKEAFKKILGMVETIIDLATLSSN